MGWFDRLDSRLRPQPRLDQRTACHGTEPVAADVRLGVVAIVLSAATPANTKSDLPVIVWICPSKDTACGGVQRDVAGPK